MSGLESTPLPPAHLKELDDRVGELHALGEGLLVVEPGDLRDLQQVMGHVTTKVVDALRHVYAHLAEQDPF
jgi:hypothetical protein